LLLSLFGRFAATGSSAASYVQAKEPVSRLINDFGPPVASAAAARQRAAMPFVKLERELWQVRDRAGDEIGPDAPASRRWLAEHGALGSLPPGGGAPARQPGDAGRGGQAAARPALHPGTGRADLRRAGS